MKIHFSVIFQWYQFLADWFFTACLTFCPLNSSILVTHAPVFYFFLSFESSYLQQIQSSNTEQWASLCLCSPTDVQYIQVCVAIGRRSGDLPLAYIQQIMIKFL